MKLFKAVILVIAIGCACGCANLSKTEKATLSELRAYGVSDTEVKMKDPAAAGVLNVFPGFGNVYLAVGTDESGQYLYGFLNLLFWPVSVVWGIPQAAIDANTINKKATVNYYTFDIIGKDELGMLRAKNTVILIKKDRGRTGANP